MLKTFRIGGIHPPEKKLSAGKQICVAAIPAQVIIPLSQHIGAPAQAVVSKGDAVKVGTLLAKSCGYISANIHSPVSGKVSKIDDVPDMSGYKKKAVFIDVEGDEWEESIDRSTELTRECSLTAQEIIDKIAEAGIVGMGGATFPAHAKLTPPAGVSFETLIINAAECEPYLTSDHALMLDKSEEIMVGVSLLMKAIGVKKVFIGIENNKADAISALSQQAKKFEGIEVTPLKARYPQGGEKQLIDAILRRQLKSGSLPSSVGTAVLNVGTTYAVYEAVMKNKPLIERIVTVTGNGIAVPSVFRVRIGTPLCRLIEAAGGYNGNTGKIIGGGPMMGKALLNDEMPIVKGSSGILILTEEEAVRKPAHNCIRCAKCVNACPMGLNPTLLMNVTEFSQWDIAEKNYISDCIDCGSCSYICPSNRPLVDYIRLGKVRVKDIINKRKK